MKKTQTKKFNHFAWILFVLVILNFFNTGILRFYVGIAVCATIIIFLLTNEGWLLIKGMKKVTSLSLLIFTFIYGLNVYLFRFVDFSHFIMYIISPICFYIAGYYIATRSNDNRYKYLINMAIIIPMAIYGFLCVIYTINKIGTIIVPFSGTRYVIDFWTGNLSHATIVSTYISLGIGMFAVLFIKAENKFASVVKIILLSIFVMCLYCGYFLASRTVAVIGVVTFTITLIMIYSKFKELIRIIFLVGIFSLIFYFSYSTNLFNLKNIITYSPFAQRFSYTDVNEDPRFKVWKQAAQGLIDHPEGKRATILEADFAHNFLLDIGYDAGILAFVFALTFIISSIVDFIIFLRQRGAPILLKAVTVSMFIIFILSFMVQPIIEGFFTYFLAFCFFIAFVSGMKFKQEQMEIIS